MASVGTVRVAALVSLATTGAAAYYFLSDGGDAAKLHERLRDTRAKLDSTVSSARDWTISTASAVQAKGAALVADRQNKDTNSIQNTSNQPEHTEDMQQRQTGAFCHTCSGPRIWFFAEKLRLKRRITPYPDPPRD